MIQVPLLKLRGTFNTGVTFIFMLFCTLDTSKSTNNIQVVTIIFLFLCCLFCVYDTGFIFMLIVKEIILPVKFMP